MKLILAFLLGFACAALAQPEEIPRERRIPVPANYPAKADALLYGQIVQVVEGGFICAAHVNPRGDYLTTRHDVFVYGHPKQTTCAEGEAATRFYAARTGNWRMNGRVLRAYKFVEVKK